ncbi:DEAD/DEAH box helicase [Pikeienuella piscinae]|uniref:DEAD-box ATP-dependent RNA helicase RhpA n=1 Tax=Pikeienuella piscinae TaxID=2748098 RepID=A0A7L5BTT4_9RHOB|nr:DEAD/DEAH box helicase [Pikeienuella piscinae]QIE54253.1 DEAD/DEAH box helicase [Pikeienuella piscinae]
MTSFSELNLDPKVYQAILEAGYDTPTPIQEQAIPHALMAKDVLGIAQTGTGKTAAFTLPMITILAQGRARARMPRSLVLCPTRELAAQVAENFEIYGKYHKLTMALLIGGVSFKDQDKLIDRGVDVLIATPGRLLDHFERGKLMLTGIEIMVVDEADRMLDMGFIPDIERIFKLTPFTRQTLFFSATMPPEITRLTQEFLHNPVRIEVARQATTGENISQRVIEWKASSKEAADSEKRDLLRALIDAEGEKLTNAIVFCNRKSNVDIVAKSLSKHGYNAAPIHGDLDQKVRMRTLDAFRANELRILVASDVAARGLDIPIVSHVFNFDVPIHSEDYVHRIGRTGRAGRAGDALTLCLPHETKYLDKIEELIETKIDRTPPPADAVRVGRKPRPEPRGENNRRARRPRRDESRRNGSETEEARSVEAESAAAPATEQPPAAQKNEPKREQQAEQAAPKQNQRRRESGGGLRNSNAAQRNNGDGAPVKGLGDHMPAFMSIPLPKLKSTRTKSSDKTNNDEAAA